MFALLGIHLARQVVHGPFEKPSDTWGCPWNLGEALGPIGYPSDPCGSPHTFGVDLQPLE